jgi:transcription elongation factor Elf1
MTGKDRPKWKDRKNDYKLRFNCGECNKTAVVQYELKAGETAKELRKRNPILIGACAAHHVGSYMAPNGLAIVPALSFEE